MSILIYDENSRQRFSLEDIILQLNREGECDSNIHSFGDSAKALQYAGKDTIEAAFISMEDNCGRGFFLAKKLKIIDADINLIPMANELKYGKELMKLRISGYIIGECTREKILDELDNLRYP